MTLHDSVDFIVESIDIFNFFLKVSILTHHVFPEYQ